MVRRHAGCCRAAAHPRGAAVAPAAGAVPLRARGAGAARGARGTSPVHPGPCG